MKRRTFLKSTSLLGVVALPKWTHTLGKPASNYGMPSPFERKVGRLHQAGFEDIESANYSMTPLQDLYGIITPSGLVFERHHAGVPEINPDEHRLMIHGMVERPLVLSMDELMRFPSVTKIHFLECSGNSKMRWANLPNRKQTAQSLHGSMSCCEWTGVPLSSVLDAVGIKRGARWILAEGADSAAVSRSIPLEKCLDDALLVYGQNGERLRPENGYPLRLLLPGFEGNTNIKWLRRLKVGDQPFNTREETARYTDLLPDGKARQFSFLMETKSVITFPSGGQKLKQRGPYEISGIAWSGRGCIRAVDISVDGGKTWTPSQLQEPILAKCLTRFRLPWVWKGGPAVLMSRAVDETGYIQPQNRQLREVRGEHSSYHNNAIQPWSVGESGDVLYEA